MSAEVQAAKARLLELETQRKAIEQQIEECTGRLTAPGGAGLTGSLVDKEVGGADLGDAIKPYRKLQMQP